MAITKKIIIPIIIVLLMFMPMVSACNEVSAEQQQTTIIEKYEREEYETFKSYSSIWGCGWNDRKQHQET